MSAFDNASHHTRHVTGLRVIEGSFGGGDVGDRIIQVSIGGSLLCGLAVPRTFLWGSNTRAGLSRSLRLATRLASAAGRNWRGGRGRRTSIFVGAIGLGTIVGVSRHVVRRRGSELRDSGTRELVGSITESVDEDTGVVVLVGTRESDKFIGAGRSFLATTDFDLHTGGVELGTSGLISQVKGDDLVTKEISAASEVRRELEGMGLPVDCNSSVSNRKLKNRQTKQ